jgi:hypothetical protein
VPPLPNFMPRVLLLDDAVQPSGDARLHNGQPRVDLPLGPIIHTIYMTERGNAWEDVAVYV